HVHSIAPAVNGERLAAAWGGDTAANAACMSQVWMRSFCGPPYGDLDDGPTCPNGSANDASPVANVPFSSGFFTETTAPMPEGLGLVLSMQGMGCEICGDRLEIAIRGSLPICAPETIEWDVNAGIFGPDVEWCSGSLPCMEALSGNITFVAFESGVRAAGSF